MKTSKTYRVEICKHRFWWEWSIGALESTIDAQESAARAEALGYKTRIIEITTTVEEKEVK